MAMPWANGVWSRGLAAYFIINHQAGAEKRGLSWDQLFKGCFGVIFFVVDAFLCFFFNHAFNKMLLKKGFLAAFQI